MFCRIARSSTLFAYAATSACSPSPRAAAPEATRLPGPAPSTLASSPFLAPPQQPSDPSKPWTPEEPALNEDAPGWTTGQLQSACERVSPVTRVIENAEAFRAAFCFDAELDWSRFRVAMFVNQDPSARRALRVVDVVRRPDQWLVIVERSGACCADVWACNAAAVALIPASPLPVQFLSRASSMPTCVAPRDGYGY